ncbi:hypothetical protein GCM10023231_21170 [Olivibacter ginsenosidimutans]|uniref:DUF2938 domain-containing protein n=1 Tax=Olivibacter ginsenosidimutans TaxID=1176537 RepID=A0ABP9BAB0_9SPHI
MEIKKVLIPGTIGTSAMTIFSYAIAAAKDRRLEEPILLAKLIKPLVKHRYKNLAHPTGWAMHYTMGCLMTSAFQEYWKQNTTIPTVKDGIISGAAGGIAGILIWKVVFKIASHTPHISFKRYYGHLLLAHFVFGVTVALTSRLTSPFKTYKPSKIAEETVAKRHKKP